MATREDEDQVIGDLIAECQQDQMEPCAHGCALAAIALCLRRLMEAAEATLKEDE